MNVRALSRRRPGRRGGGQVTLEHVASAARVSRATASRVVNGDQRVGEQARTAVQTAIRDLGYVPNRAARSLVTRRSDSVAVVIPEPTTQLFGDPFFPRVLRGISDGLSAAGLQLVLLMPQAPGDAERVERYLAAGHTDGVMLVSLHGTDPLPERLRRHRVPLVVGGRPPAEGSSYVDVDNRGGAERAVDHLVRIGRRRIATIAGPLDMAAGSDRLAGYRRRIAAAGLAADDALVEIADFSHDGGRNAMERLLDRAPSLDAVFVASDLMAVGAVAALRAAGRSIPDDVAIVGFDDSQLAVTVEPNLSSVQQPIEEMGREMARLLLDEIRAPGRPARHVVLGTTLVVRGSSMATTASGRAT
jgi:DNA-binding LacI/PurR family transcriptional regulator